jgi:hypothetical protein
MPAKVPEYPPLPEIPMEERNAPRLVGLIAPPEEKANGETAFIRLLPEKELPTGYDTDEGKVALETPSSAPAEGKFKAKMYIPDEAPEA